MQNLTITELKWIANALYNERIEAENLVDRVDLDNAAKALLRLKADNYKAVETKIKKAIDTHDKRIAIK